MEKCSISSHTTNSSGIILANTKNSYAANMMVVVGLVAIILVFLIRAVLRLLQPRPPNNMSAPVEESLDQYSMFAKYPYNQLVFAGRSPPTTQCLFDPSCTMPKQPPCAFISPPFHSFTLYYFIFSIVVVCTEQMLEDAPIQESIQCSTNKGKAVTVIGGNEYPPPADD